MAGYIFSLDSLESLKLYLDHGVYATKLSTPNNLWLIHHEATFADYATMKPGDNVYFFIQRKIYGLGKLINLASQDCKFSNFPEACIPKKRRYLKDNNLLWDEGGHSIDQRWLCTFEPDPSFFINGIDMDDVLASNPDAFRMLRAFWKVSFIKFDEEENQAFRDVLLKYNQLALASPKIGENVFVNDNGVMHGKIANKLNEDDYRLKISPFLDSCHEGDYIRHEMAIEAAILYQLTNMHEPTINVFGKWDYLSHQVIASPFKPIDYMDKMDIFGYAYVAGHKPTKSKYLIAEIKKDSASVEDVEQILKYVDWVKDEYCHNDYSMIEAFLVAYSFNEDVIEHKRNSAKRQYTIGRRPAQSLTWNDLKLVQYRYNEATELLNFTVIT